MIFNCKHCGAEFEAPNRKNNRQKYCCKECYWEANKGARLNKKKCKSCGVEFQPRGSHKQFCSTECYREYRRLQRIVKCKECGKEFKRRKAKNIYCSLGCSSKNRIGSNNPRFRNYLSKDEAGYIRFSKAHPRYPDKRLHQVVWSFKNGSNVCELCGDTREVIHHIDGNKRNNKIGNLQGLCNSCHRKIHSQKAKVKAT